MKDSLGREIWNERIWLEAADFEPELRFTLVLRLTLVLGLAATLVAVLFLTVVFLTAAFLTGAFRAVVFFAGAFLLDDFFVVAIDALFIPS